MGRDPCLTQSLTFFNTEGIGVVAVMSRAPLARLRELAVRHPHFSVALAVGALLRLVAMLAYPGTLWFAGDSYVYVGAALRPTPDQSKTTGYSLFLRALLPFHSFTLVTGLQHLMGLGIAVMVYVLARRAGVSKIWATAATLPVLERGQERYNVYCTPCHSRVGNGEGMIVQRGYLKAGNFHTTRLETAPLGHFFHVITNGYGAMPDYAAQVAPVDRWAIVAYIKALQLSQKATQADVPAGEHVESLSSIAERDGLPASFTNDWVLPPTAVTGTPDNGLFILPVPGAGTGAAAPSHTNSTPPAAVPAGKTVPKQ